MPVVIVGVLVSALLAGCSSSSSSSSSSDGVTLDLAVTPAPLTASRVSSTPGVSKTIEMTGLSNASSLTLTKAYLVILTSEITTDCNGPSNPVYSLSIDGLLDILVPPAMAHTDSTPTLNGTPYVVDIMSPDDTPLTLGQFSPAPGNYCGVELITGSADIDTERLPTDVPAGMVGLSLYIAGSFSPASATDTFEIKLSLPINNGEPRRLKFAADAVLSSSSLTGDVLIAVNYDTWFDGVDLDVLAESIINQDYLDNIALLENNILGSIH